MRLWLLALLAALPAAAFAKPAAETAPVPLETQHICMLPPTGNFPLAPTLASFTVAPNGSVKDVWLADKSGIAAIDDAAKTCAGAWRYRPATRAGKPVEKVWQDVIRWNARVGATNVITVSNRPPPPPGGQQTHEQIVTPVSVGRPHSCESYYPKAAIDAHAQGTTLMSFRVTADGSTKDVTVTKSSGNADLDAAAQTCVAQWKYRPAMSNGAPVEMPWQANVLWSLAGGPRPYDTPPVRQESASCAAFYTPEMVKERPVRSRLFQVTIGTDGLVSNVVAPVPADALLDDVSTACIKSWHFVPALKDGAPVQVTILQLLNWSMQGLLLPKAPRGCAKFAGPSAAAPSGIEGITGVHFRVTTDGRAEDVALDRSSTSDALDQAALACAATWRFDTQGLALPPGGYPQHVIIDWQRELAAPK
ncbi:MAG TPA: TonB family protein [Rhizomicrobium sp.]|nr:TonB family protein [Rhizomicrobium sp.]